MLKCIIIEDHAPAQFLLQKYIEETEGLTLSACFNDVIEAQSHIDKEQVDLVFLDINLPKISGIDFLRKFNKSLPLTILTTARPDFALESYEYKVADYLLKPFTYERFLQAIEKAQLFDAVDHANSEPEKEDFIYIKEGHNFIKLALKSIHFIQSDGDYTEVYLKDRKHITSDALKEWLKKLDNRFCQVHKSFIINLDVIKQAAASKIVLSQGQIIPVGRAYKKAFLERYLQTKH